MSILVVCPGCRKSFKVSDKFAGQTGACPKCKGKITVPTLKEEVKVHTPTEFASGGRSTTGELVTKPIARQTAKFNPVVAVAIAGAAAVVLVMAWAGGEWFQNSPLLCALGLLAVSPPLVIGAYTFLRDEELQPYQATALYVRAGICSLAYILLWGAFSYVGSLGLLSVELWTWLLVAAPILIVGALAAHGSLDLNYGNGLLHYAFYVLVTMLLRGVAGLGWLWEASSTPGL